MSFIQWYSPAKLRTYHCVLHVCAPVYIYVSIQSMVTPLADLGCLIKLDNDSEVSTWILRQARKGHGQNLY